MPVSLVLVTFTVNNVMLQKQYEVILYSTYRGWQKKLAPSGTYC